MTDVFIFTKSAASVCMMAICINSKMLWRVIRWIGINCKVPLCHANELNPKRSCSRRMCWYHSLFMAVFLGKIVSEPTPEKQPTDEWSHMNGLRMLYCWHDTGLMVALILFSPDKLFFRMPQTIGKGNHQRKGLYPRPQQSNPCTFCRTRGLVMSI